MQTGLPLGQIFYETAEQKNNLVAVLKPLAASLRGRIGFASIDATIYAAYAKTLRLRADLWPAFVIEGSIKTHIFPFFRQGPSLAVDDEFERFVYDILDGRIQPGIMSEPIPEQQMQNSSVITVVGRSFSEVVLDSQMDVVVYFYKPECPYSSMFFPVFEEVATLHRMGEDIAFASVDVQANDVPQTLEGFPTIRIFRKGSKLAPIEFSQRPTVEDLVAFIQQKKSQPVGGFHVEDALGEPLGGIKYGPDSAHDEL